MKVLILVWAFSAALVYGAESKELPFTTLIMESTVKLSRGTKVGTGFIVGKLDPTIGTNRYRHVLVTAHHVLAEMEADNITLTTRKLKPDESWERIDHPISIRSAGRQLWLKHEDVDLAAMYVRLPPGSLRDILTESLLVTDAEIGNYEIGPGSPVLCVGYPLGFESNAEGFPVLRSSRISSYPLLPTKKTKTFLLDFNIFGGNSGGPVFLFETNPVYGGSTHIGRIQGILGVISEQHMLTEKTVKLNRTETIQTPLALGVAIHGSFVKELISKLPNAAFSQRSLP